MTYDVQWTAAALVSFKAIPSWTTAAAVDGPVQRLARERAQRCAAGEYRFTVAGYAVRVRVNHDLRTVLVLYVFRLG